MSPTLRQLAVDITAFIHSGNAGEERFNDLARELFAFQFEHNAALRQLCFLRGVSSPRVASWQEIPGAPTAAFKELDLTVVPDDQRVATFHSSGTTGHRQSRHFHSRESLAVYETSLLRGFERRFPTLSARMLFLTPPPAEAPHSSLVHMFETLRRGHPECDGRFFGRLGAEGSWCLDFDPLVAALCSERPVAVLGTAFNFVHLLDQFAGTGIRLVLAPGSFVMETGGYKGRSRSLPREELHQALSVALGLPRSEIAREYGMSELSSQAYDVFREDPCFEFPGWTRIRIISPETGAEVREGEPGLLRVCDVANLASALVVQTEDLAIRRGRGFELIGRAPAAGPRGCSLMTD